MKNILYILLLLSIFAMQACYQDLDDEPDFNYPEAGLEPTGEYEPLKLDLPFDGEPFDKSNYQFIPVLSEGVELNYGMGMKGLAARLSGESPYIVYKPYPSIKNSVVNELSNLDGWTVAFWMKAPKNDKTIGMFSIPETNQFWVILRYLWKRKTKMTLFIRMTPTLNYIWSACVVLAGRKCGWNRYGSLMHLTNGYMRFSLMTVPPQRLGLIIIVCRFIVRFSIIWISYNSIMWVT